MAKTPEEQLAEIEERRKALDAKARRVKAKISAAERKADHARKVRLGGMLIGAARNEAAYGRVIAKLVPMMGEKDRAYFEGWAIPQPEDSDRQISKDDG